MRKLASALLLAACPSAAAQSIVHYGDATLLSGHGLTNSVQAKSVHLYSSDGELGLYVFCADSRTPNVSVYLLGGDFAEYGYLNGANIPVTWQADRGRAYTENWHVIGQNDDLRRYGPLGLITAELFKTRATFKVKLFDRQYTFPARGVGEAMRNLSCVVPFLRSTHYLK